MVLNALRCIPLLKRKASCFLKKIHGRRSDVVCIGSQRKHLKNYSKKALAMGADKGTHILLGRVMKGFDSVEVYATFFQAFFKESRAYDYYYLLV